VDLLVNKIILSIFSRIVRLYSIDFRRSKRSASNFIYINIPFIILTTNLTMIVSSLFNFVITIASNLIFYINVLFRYLVAIFSYCIVLRCYILIKIKINK